METAMGGIIVVIVLAFVIIVIVAKTAVVVPQQSAYVVERLGKYSGTLSAGFHILSRSSTSSATSIL
jgi:regulator of protease activity HflC (stomatin/prohibitin superfamily)